jgi:sugar lactone lactonase YvrE
MKNPLSNSWKRIVEIALLSCLVAHPLSAAEVIEVGANPESVTRGFGGKYFITLMGPTRTPGDGNGSIVVLEDKVPKTFCDGMDDPKGIVMMGDHLITTDFTRVWKVNSEGKKEVLAGPEAFPHPPLFLNDVMLAPDGQSVLVTDMGARDKMFGPDGLWPLDSAEAKALPVVGRLYRITLDGKVTEVIAANPTMPCPNGVDQLPNGTIRIAEFFTGKILERSGEDWKVLAEGHRTADGIGHDKKGRFYVSEVGTGKVWRYEADGSGKVQLGEGLVSAADLLVDEKAGVLIVPDTKSGKIVLIDL